MERWPVPHTAAHDAATPHYPDRVLLVGVSVRMLAQSCARAGIGALALDWFADSDTAACSEHCEAVIRADALDFDRARLAALAERLAPAGSGVALIYGGGMDGRPDLLETLAQGRTLYGNAPDTVKRVKTPHRFFPLLDDLGIPYPPTQLAFSRPVNDPGEWLVKHRSGEGGTGISRFGAGQTVPLDCYLQRRLCGPGHSLLFLADGTDIAAIGFNRLMTTNHRDDRPLLFGGALTPAELTVEQRLAVHGHALALTRALRLVGLNSLDFIVREGRCHVLEINPRPSATLGLHDQAYPRGLIAAHIAACRGTLTRAAAEPRPPRGFRIVYADRDFAVPPGVAWPDWAADRPAAGTFIASGNPVCTVTATAPSVAELERQLFARQQLIRAPLML
ncbi:MAG: ATP-grasp domain-containing protein [Gammaproteobacteria bacterium]|nr:ATP-grasp domain-containing protein [Gammaproteobacteria bacterium]